ncbi:MAG: hypothetical protein CL596_02785 [Alteromonas sp.]|nr:hypothetical protein [Alteromonas sp.]MAY23487.1 hypothetical protein [Flavobacteriaceae bacterium]
MRLFTLSFTLLFGMILGSYAQVPTPMNTNTTGTTSGLSWKKVNDYDYELRDDGKLISNVLDLKYLKTDTLAILDKTSRTIYLLEDFRYAASGSNGKASVLKKGVDTNFYLTNKYSFAFYTNDEYLSGAFVNIGGTYVYYLAERDATYLLKDIRKFSNWGANSAEKLEYTPSHVYWCRVADSNSYHVVEKGQSMDYTNTSTEKSGNDLIIKVNGVDKYILPGYYTTASYVFKPVKMASGSNNNNPVSGNSDCVSGDCQNGWGKYQYENGYYDGFWKNGKKDGYGMYKWDGLGKYIGNWENDTMNGYGVYIADNNDNIIGEYKNGQLNGLGITVTGNTWDQGYFTNGNITTHYDFYSTGKETGCTAGDCENKYGRFKWSNGDSFTGFFKNGKLYMGTYTFASGDKYSGMFNSNNQFHGTGRFFFADDSYYGGNWVNGQYEGRGYFHDKELKQKIGEWSNGKLVRSMK